jgi:hypothetical protein
MLDPPEVTPVPFVYVRSCKTKKDRLKKVLLLQKNMPAFVSSIERILGGKSPIRSLLRVDGTLIHSLAEITPGMTILASDVDPDFEQPLPRSPSPEPSGPRPPPTAKSSTKKGKTMSSPASIVHSSHDSGKDHSP